MKPVISALGLFAAGSLMYLMKSYISQEQTIAEKQLIKEVLITLRKRVFSTLREIAFVVNNIKTHQSEFEPKKISDIVMKDGGSGDAKLNLIQELTIKNYHLTRKSFQASCNFYRNNDYEIRLLLKNLSLDIQLALSGTIQSFNGATPYISSDRVIYIYREILKRRMENIKEKLINKSSNEDCLQREFMIEQFLELNGVNNQKQANQKVFISILQKNYREDADFRIQFQNLEVQMAEFMEEIQQYQQKTHLESLEEPEHQKDKNSQEGTIRNVQ